MFAGDALLVASKDLRIEWRSRTTLGVVVPFALLVLVLFGFALSANRPALRFATPGLLWMTVLFVAVMTAQGSVMLEADDGARRALLLSGMAPSAAFLGKAAAVAVQLLAVEVMLLPGVVVLYGAEVGSLLLVGATSATATVGLAASGTLLSAMTAGSRVHQTVLPVLMLPVTAPVLIAATRAFGDAFGTAAVDGWAWVGLLAAFAVVNTSAGCAAYGTLLEDG